MAEDEILQETKVVEKAPDEKMLSQTQVDDIVSKRVAEAQAKARQQAQAEFEAKYQRMQEEKNQSQMQGDGDMRQMNADAIYQQVQEKFNQEMERKAYEDQITRVAQNYHNKVNAAKSAYEDFDDIMANFEPDKFPELIFLVANMDNAGDIVYDIAKNPQKLTHLYDLALRSPKMAQAELAKLSKSITDNKMAIAEARQTEVDAPLGRLKPSQISGNSGKMTLRDLKNQPWLRG